MIATILVSLANGAFEVNATRFVEETMPSEAYPVAMAAYHIGQNVAKFLGSEMTRILPDDDDTEALEENQTFRFIYLVNVILDMLLKLPNQTVQYLSLVDRFMGNEN